MEAFRKRTATVQFAIDQLKGTVTAFIQESGEPLLDVLNELVLAVKGIFDGFREFSPEVKNAITLFTALGIAAASVAAAVAVIIRVGVFLLPVLTKMAAVIPSVLTFVGLGALVPFLGPIAVGIVAITSAVFLLKSAWKQTNAQIEEFKQREKERRRERKETLIEEREGILTLLKLRLESAKAEGKIFLVPKIQKQIEDIQRIQIEGGKTFIKEQLNKQKVVQKGFTDEQKFRIRQARGEASSLEILAKERQTLKNLREDWEALNKVRPNDIRTDELFDEFIEQLKTVTELEEELQKEEKKASDQRDKIFKEELERLVKETQEEIDQSNVLQQIKEDIAANERELNAETRKQALEANKTFLEEEIKNLETLADTRTLVGEEQENLLLRIIELKVEVKNIDTQIASQEKKQAKDARTAERERIRALKEALKGTESLSEALSISLELMASEAETFGEQVDEGFRRLLDGISDSFSDFFFNQLTGQMTSFKDFFKSLTNSMIRIWSDMLAEMLTNFIKNQIKQRIESQKTTSTMKTGSKGAASEITDDFSKMGSDVMGMFSRLGKGILSVFGQIGGFFGLGGSRAAAAPTPTPSIPLSSPEFIGPRLPGIGEAGGPLGPAQPANTGILGRLGGIGGILGSAGTGAGIGGILGSITGSTGPGSQIGGAAGSIIGSAFGPIGTFVGGAAGGLIGGLFGKDEKDPVRKQIKAWVSGTLIPTLDRLTKLGFSEGIFGTGGGTTFFKQLGFEQGVPQAILERMVRVAEKLQDILSNAIGSAFEKSTKESAWRTFLRDVREGLSDFVTEAFVKSIVKSGLVTRVLAPFFEETDKLLRKFKRGKITEGELQTGITTAFKRTEPALLGLESTITGLFGTLKGINDVIEGKSPGGNLGRILPSGFFEETVAAGTSSFGNGTLGKKEVTVNAPVTVQAEISNTMDAIKTGKGISFGLEKEMRRITI
jgi:hypothetical protein